MAIATVLQLITAACEELEVIDSGGSLSTAEQASALDRFNRMVDASSAQRGLIFTERIDLLTLTIGKQTYTIGIDPSGSLTANYNIARPVRITDSNLLLSSTVRRPIKVLTKDQWADIRYQAVTGPPAGVYNDAAFVSGFATLYFDRIPDQAYQWEMYSWQQNARVTAVSVGVDYPPGYADFWLYNLAIRLAPMFGRSVSADLRESFRAAREVIKALNCPSPEMRTEAALLSGDGAGLYDWMDGQQD